MPSTRCAELHILLRKKPLVANLPLVQVACIFEPFKTILSILGTPHIQLHFFKDSTDIGRSTTSKSFTSPMNWLQNSNFAVVACWGLQLPAALQQDPVDGNSITRLWRWEKIKNWKARFLRFVVFFGMDGCGLDDRRVVKHHIWLSNWSRGKIWSPLKRKKIIKATFFCRFVERIPALCLYPVDGNLWCKQTRIWSHGFWERNIPFCLWFFLGVGGGGFLVGNSSCSWISPWKDGFATSRNQGVGVM